ncbi:hypothetical protein [Streptomyces sp. NBC_00557]|uniref:hypothetical protein n=1 Tax=Streptomyces sp. NBC_00557 TaxID=2975776 RepID=UPI002E7FC94F|nr:hypothetical protein [Streptomyces sp. NBC_00557]WUC39674.1 hypothetical protein OG956_38605 [Streptomyces sp. NBC_00557]
MPNAELAARILHQITEYPEHYNQTYWLNGTDILFPHTDLNHSEHHCGTTLCIAGHAAHLTGYTLTSDHATKPRHPTVSIYAAARAELELTEEDATWLFWGGRTPAQTRAALAQLAAGAPSIDQATIHATWPTTP